MADFECYPLWVRDESRGDEIHENTSPHSSWIGLSDELATALNHWADEFDATLDPDDPKESGFRSQEDWSRFVRRGRELAERVSGEMGEEWSVLYFDDLERKSYRIS
ncbi:hypothetical protein F4561_000176 [Lipingzhangella halophila]|uniref:Uncharacterized protein n=1 Tax=Lipingzhangella halophila TaxID=1783352 RepID=A0A7W7W090_9ACTN|nr:hypothetical protein [Lipingzhangella halophila]MBB4929356.1 hypothetical protein [Lipingzhangella halophila]